MSFASELLQKVEDLLSGKLTSDAASYSIAGRSITKYSIDELMKLRAKLKAEVEVEELALAGKKPIRAVRYYFT